MAFQAFFCLDLFSADLHSCACLFIALHITGVWLGSVVLGAERPVSGFQRSDAYLALVSGLLLTRCIVLREEQS